MGGRTRSFFASVAFLVGTIGLAAGAILFFPHAGNSVIGQQWIQIGPAPLQINAEQNFQGAGPDSGMVDDIAIDPRGGTDQTIYIATENGGIWKTLDGGTTWKPKTDFMPSNSMGAVALDPGNPSVVYAGTGFLIPQGLFKGIGLYKSTDGGDSWTVIGPSFLNGAAIVRIVLPAPNTLLVATNIGLFLSVDGGANFGNNSPTFDNGGAVLGGLISDLHLDTVTPTTIRAAVAGTGIFVSTDAGETWPTNLFLNPGAPMANVGFITFAQSTNPDNMSLYASVADSRGQTNPPMPAPFPYLGLFVSTDTGSTWTGKQTGVGSPGTGCQCGYDQTIGVDPATASTVYIGFQEDYKSIDSGTTFNKISLNKIHFDHHALIFSPATHPTGPPTQWYDGNDGGIAVTSDGGTTFNNAIQGVFPNALATNLFRGLDIGRGSAFNDGFTYGGQQDTGTNEFLPGFTNNTWQLGIDGDGGMVSVESTNPFVALGTDDGGATRTTTGGTAWAGPAGFPAFTGEGVPFFDPNGTNAYFTAATAPAAMMPANLFRIFFSTDHGATFAPMHSFPTFINAMSMAKIDSNTLWAGLADGTVQNTGNALMGAASTWTSHTVTGAPAGQGVSSIAVDPSNTNVVYVTYSGFSSIDPNLFPTKHIFETTDGGTTWTDISGLVNGGSNNLPDLPLHSVVIDPMTSPHTIIVASDSAVFQSADNGQTWQVLGLGMPTVDITSLAIDAGAAPPLLRASTFGRSAFQLAAATTALIAVNADLNFGTVCPGQQATLPVEVFNVGVKDLHIASFTRISGSTDFTILPNPATPLTISPDAHVDFTIQFAPTVVGPQTATFQINSDDPNTPAFQLTATGSEGSGTVQLTGSGAFGSTICAGPNRPTQTIKVDNVGTCNLHLINAFPTCADFTLVNPPTFPVPISPDSGIDLTVQFTPTSAGLKACTLEVVTDDPVNPVEFLPLTATTPTGPTELTFPAGLTFPPTVIQQSGACSASLGVPVLNSGSCPVSIASVTLNHLSATPADYSLTGVPGVPSNLAPGEVLGAGNLDVVFAPFTLARTSTGTVDVEFENDPITHSLTTVSVPFCGEGVRRGMRILVTQGGVPVSTVKRIELQFAFGPEQPDGDFHTIRTIKHASLQTVTGTAPCPSFEFHQEFGGASDTFQLKDGTYRVKVFLSGVKKSKIVRVNMDQCTFTQNVVVAF